MATEAKFRRVGKMVRHTPASAVSAGDVIVVGTNPMIAERDIAASVEGDLTCEGIFEVPKVQLAMTAGQKGYWDEDGTPYGGSTTGAVTTDATKGHLMGIIEADKAAATSTVFIKLVFTAENEIVADDMVAGTGISTGTGTICEHRITKVGGIIKTEILIDLTGLTDGGTANDIIGKAGGTANCNLGQIQVEVNGTIVAGRITCFETPAGGDPDVDLYGSATEATGAQDAAISGLTGESKLCDHGDWTAEDVDYLSAIPADNGYLYLACGDTTGAAYTAGILLVELWGVAA